MQEILVLFHDINMNLRIYKATHMNVNEEPFDISLCKIFNIQ